MIKLLAQTALLIVLVLFWVLLAGVALFATPPATTSHFGDTIYNARLK